MQLSIWSEQMPKCLWTKHSQTIAPFACEMIVVQWLFWIWLWFFCVCLHSFGGITFSFQQSFHPQHRTLKVHIAHCVRHAFKAHQNLGKICFSRWHLVLPSYESSAGVFIARARVHQRLKNHIKISVYSLDHKDCMPNNLIAIICLSKVWQPQYVFQRMRWKERKNEIGKRTRWKANAKKWLHASSALLHLHSTAPMK